MVKQQKKNNRKKRSSKGFTANSTKARKINASTEYETCDEQLSPFGGLLAVIKFFDLVKLDAMLCGFFRLTRSYSVPSPISARCDTKAP